jgi:hypothetical protein
MVGASNNKTNMREAKILSIYFGVDTTTVVG